MPLEFLHGIETIEISNGIRPIQTAKSSIIGIVGTAPLAEADTKAAVALPGIANAGLLVTSKLIGFLGNATRIRVVNPGTPSAGLGVVVVGNDITVNLATTAGSVPSSTAAEVIAAIVALPAANALVTVTNDSGSTGAGILAATATWMALTGGADEPYPLNTAVLVTSQAMANRLGSTGTLPGVYSAIFNQGINTAVFVRVAEGGTPAISLTNVVGNEAAGTGLWALLAAEAVTGQVPRILAAPGFTSALAAGPASPVTLGLISVATRLRGCVIADGPNTTEADALLDRAKFGSDRLYIVDPAVKVFDPATGGFVIRPASGYVAGRLSRMDLDQGFWWSPSNQILNGVAGTARAVTFAVNSTQTEANRLNAKEVSVVVQKNGFRLWGNRTCGIDPLWAFLPVRRTADMIYESLEQALLWAMDRPFSEQLLRDIRDSVQAYLDTLKARGATLGGNCWIDPDLNTEATLKAGQFYLNFDIEPPAPMERLTFSAYRNGDYYEELIATVNSNAA